MPGIGVRILQPHRTHVTQKIAEETKARGAKGSIRWVTEALDSSTVFLTHVWTHKPILMASRFHVRGAE